MSREDEEKTGFMTLFGNFCFVGMPFGLKNAGATYQRMIDTVFSRQIGRNIEAYVDDLIVKTKAGNSHLEDLRETFEALREHNLRLNPLKCVFGAEAGKFLGFMITKRGIEVDPKQITAVQQLRAPRSALEIQSLNGKIAALGRFIPRSADKCAPFFKTLKSGTKFAWTKECEAAFQEMKAYLVSPPVLTAPKLNEKLFLYLAVSTRAVSAVLISRRNDKTEQPVYYTSRTLVSAETRYSPIEKAALALVSASQKLRPYFQAHQITVLTNLPLKKILTSMEVSGRMVKWAVELSEYDIQYAPRPAIKAQILAYFIAEGVTLETTPEGVWEVYVDGAANKHGAGAGVVVRTPTGAVHEIAIRFRTLKTNNAAEYEAILAGMTVAHELGARTIRVLSDSSLAVNQLNGTFDAKEDTLAHYMERVKLRAAIFEVVTYVQIPREENVHADALSKLATATDFETTRLVSVQKEEEENRQEVAINTTQLMPDEDRRTPIVQYLQDGTIPEDAKEAWTLRQKAARCTLIGGELYRRSFSGVYLKCIGQEEARDMVRDLHEGLCAMHAGLRSMEGTILLHGYYWPRIKKDTKKYADQCHKCQVNARQHHLPSTELQANLSPWTFAQWGVDLLGPFPTAKGKRKYIIVAVDYFTKWIEAEALASITAQQVTLFLKNNILSRFGVPNALIFDHGNQFDCAEVIDFCDQVGTIARFASVAYPQANGQAESANKAIAHGLHTRLNDAKGNWADELNTVLWAHRTTYKVATGETPFALTYGTDVVIPIRTTAPTYRITRYNEETNDEACLLVLELSQERRELAAIKLAAMKEQVAKYHNAKLVPHKLILGDQVLRRNFRPDPKHEKLASVWEGPYLIREVVGANTFKLSKLGGNKIQRTWNAQNLRKYHQAT
ncbi:unnamed protein product [Linum trigynum]|uniref:Uncharacterized protein n=1 Tax=Linum trigynum TaxID=586398 RepID=A0AAV2D911_9ROSI